MKNCKACNGAIENDVNICAHCGKDQRNFFMKHRIVTGIIGVIFLFTICLIGYNNNKFTGVASANDSTATGSVTPTDTTAAPTDTTAAPTDTTAVPTDTTAAPTGTNDATTDNSTSNDDTTWDKTAGDTNGTDWMTMNSVQKNIIVSAVTTTWKDGGHTVDVDDSWFIDALDAFYGTDITNVNSVASAMATTGTAGSVIH